MSKINIDRIVRDIKTRSTSLTPVIEAVCNSIDAIGERRTDGKIRIVLRRDGSQDLGIDNNPIKGDIISVDIIDNGEGFTDANRDSFDTFRSDLKINIGGKGFGRLCSSWPIYRDYLAITECRHSTLEPQCLYRKYH